MPGFISPTSDKPRSSLGALTEGAVHAIDTADSAEALYATIGALCPRIGWDYFSFFVSDPLQFGDRPASDPMRSTSYPEAWRARYSAQGYQRHDPLLTSGGSMRRPFPWGDDAYVGALKGRARQMFDDARVFGIRGGLTVPVHGPSGDSSVFTVSTHALGAPLRDLMRETGPLLHVVAHRMHAVMIERLLSPPADAVRLTEQERACLLWTLRGKTAWEVAQILGRSRATVNFHLQKALRKLGTSSKSHAAMKAWRTGLI